jgi:hypothetical protein
MRFRLIAFAVLAATLACAVPAARADGDPASDYLLGQSTFLSPYDGKIDKAEADRLIQMLADAKAKGFTLKVAVVVSRYDLGAVPILFRKPQTYAKFLAQEDYFIWKDELLVVMPNGYGIYQAKKLPAADQALISKLPWTDTTNGTELVVAAQRAVRALAARRGITLQLAPLPSSGSSTTRDRIVIGVGAVLAILLAFGARLLWRRRGAARPKRAR